MAYRRRKGDIVFMFKLMTGKINLKPKDLFVMSNEPTRGHKFKVKKKKVLRKTSTNVISNSDWNNLPSHVIDSASTFSFKANLDKHWANQRFEYAI